MDTSVDQARGGPAGAKARQGLTDAKLRDLPPHERAYEVSDGGNGLYVVISPSGSRPFRYDYRQAWADMLDCWMRGETDREVIVRGKVKIDEAEHDAEDMNL
jgi:hypothetical protein